MYGHVVVDGVRVPVSSVKLCRGKVLVFIQEKGPIRAAEGPVTIFGEDGIEVCQADGRLKWREIGGNEFLRLSLYVHLESVTGFGMVEASG